jgi:hypothetical protein
MYLKKLGNIWQNLAFLPLSPLGRQLSGGWVHSSWCTPSIALTWAPADACVA